MTTNETDWCGHVVWYIQYFWREVDWVGNDNKSDWRGISFGISSTFGAKTEWVGRDREIDEEHD